MDDGRRQQAQQSGYAEVSNSTDEEEEEEINDKQNSYYANEDPSNSEGEVGGEAEGEIEGEIEDDGEGYAEGEIQGEMEGEIDGDLEGNSEADADGDSEGDAEEATDEEKQINENQFSRYYANRKEGNIITNSECNHNHPIDKNKHSEGNIGRDDFQWHYTRVRNERSNQVDPHQMNYYGVRVEESTRVRSVTSQGGQMTGREDALRVITEKEINRKIRVAAAMQRSLWSEVVSETQRENSMNPDNMEAEDTEESKESEPEEEEELQIHKGGVIPLPCRETAAEYARLSVDIKSQWSNQINLRGARGTENTTGRIVSELHEGERRVFRARTTSSSYAPPLIEQQTIPNKTLIQEKILSTHGESSKNESNTVSGPCQFEPNLPGNSTASVNQNPSHLQANAMKLPKLHYIGKRGQHPSTSSSERDESQQISGAGINSNVNPNYFQLQPHLLYEENSEILGRKNREDELNREVSDESNDESQESSSELPLEGYCRTGETAEAALHRLQLQQQQSQLLYATRREQAEQARFGTKEQGTQRPHFGMQEELKADDELADQDSSSTPSPQPGPKSQVPEKRTSSGCGYVVRMGQPLISRVERNNQAAIDQNAYNILRACLGNAAMGAPVSHGANSAQNAIPTLGVLPHSTYGNSNAPMTPIFPTNWRQGQQLEQALQAGLARLPEGHTRYTHQHPNSETMPNPGYQGYVPSRSYPYGPVHIYPENIQPVAWLPQQVGQPTHLPLINGQSQFRNHRPEGHEDTRTLERLRLEMMGQAGIMNISRAVMEPTQHNVPSIQTNNPEYYRQLEQMYSGYMNQGHVQTGQASHEHLLPSNNPLTAQMPSTLADLRIDIPQNPRNSSEGHIGLASIPTYQGSSTLPQWYPPHWIQPVQSRQVTQSSQLGPNQTSHYEQQQAIQQGRNQTSQQDRLPISLQDLQIPQYDPCHPTLIPVHDQHHLMQHDPLQSLQRKNLQNSRPDLLHSAQQNHQNIPQPNQAQSLPQVHHLIPSLSQDQSHQRDLDQVPQRDQTHVSQQDPLQGQSSHMHPDFQRYLAKHLRREARKAARRSEGGRERRHKKKRSKGWTPPFSSINTEGETSRPNPYDTGTMEYAGTSRDGMHSSIIEGQRLHSRIHIEGEMEGHTIDPVLCQMAGVEFNDEEDEEDDGSYPSVPTTS